MHQRAYMCYTHRMLLLMGTLIEAVLRTQKAQQKGDDTGATQRHILMQMQIAMCACEQTLADQKATSNMTEKKKIRSL